MRNTIHNTLAEKFTPLENRHRRVVVINKKNKNGGSDQNYRHGTFLTGLIFYGIVAVLFLPLVSPLFLAPIGIVLFPDSFAKAIVFRVTVEILFILFLFSVLQKRRRHNYENRCENDVSVLLKPKLLFWLLAAMWFVIGLATLFSLEPRQSMWDLQYRSLGFFFYSHLFVFFFILIYFLRNQKVWDRIFSIIIGVAGMVSLLGILQWFGIYFKESYIEVTGLDRPGATLGNPNSFGAYLVITLPITFLYLLKSWRLWRLGNPVSKTILFGAILILEIIGLIVAGSRAAFLGFLTSLIILLLLYPFQKLFIKKAIWIVLICIILFLIIGVWTGFLNNLWIFHRFYNLLSDSGLTRLTAWQSGLKSFTDRPVLGFGPENFAIAFDRNYSPFFGSISGIEEHWWGKAHNFIIEWLVGIGIAGFAIYALVYSYLFSSLYKINRHRGDNNSAARERALSPRVTSAVLISLLGGYLIFNSFNFDVPTNLVLIFIIFGYSYFLISNSSNVASDPPNQREARQPRESEIIHNRQLIKNGIIASPTLLAIILGIMSMIFLLWNYNLKPFFINIEANKIETEFEARPEESFNNYLEVLGKQTYIDHDLSLRFYVQANKYADYLRRQGNNQKASEIRKILIKKLEKNLTLKPYYTRNYLFLGDSYTYLVALDPENKQENFNRAKNYYLKSIELSPKRQEGYLGLSQLYRSVGQYDESIKILNNVVELNDQYGPAHFWLAINYFYKDKMDNGKEELKKALNSGYQLPLENLKIVFKDKPEILQEIMDEVK